MRCRHTLLLFLFLASCGRSGPPPLPRGTLELVEIAPPKSFNPVTSRERSTTFVTGFLHAGLVEMDGVTLEMMPGLAASWTLSPDGRTYTFVLRDDAKFSDGRSVTAEDVRFTLEDVIYNPTVENSTRDNLVVDEKPFTVRVVDTRTVEITTPRPFAPALRSFGFEILPAHRYRDLARSGQFGGALDLSTPLSEIVGAGPYRIASYRPGEEIVFEANPHYFRPLATKQVHLRIVKDMEAAFLDFRSGGCDVTSDWTKAENWPDLTRGAAPDDPRGYSARNLGPTPKENFVFFQQSRASDLPDWKIALFRDARFRRALSLAIDRPRLIDNVYQGLAFPGGAAVSPANTLFHDTSLESFRYDLEGAKALLAEIGCRWEGGKLLAPSGEPVAFEIMTNSENNERMKSVEIVASGWRALGIDATTRGYDFNALVGRLDNDYAWEACMLGLTGIVDPHFGGNVWKMEGNLHQWNQRPRLPVEGASAEVTRLHPGRLARWRAGIQPWEREIDRIIQAQATEMNPARRVALFHELQRIVRREEPYLYTVTPASLSATRNRVANWKVTAMGGALHNIEELDPR